MRGRFYYCAHGQKAAWSKRCLSAEEAAKECFGTTEGVTALSVGTEKPGSFAQKRKSELFVQLAKLHQDATGNVLI